MGSKYDFILENIRFSYSSTSTFSNCKHSYKLSYIDDMPRENNFFGEYGTVIHECFEKYFRGEVEYYDLSTVYRDNYDKVVKSAPPPYPAGMADRYKEQGQAFFDNFSFDKELYTVLSVEDKIDFDFDGSMFVAKPDLVLMEKSTNNYILFDYKTSTPFKINKETGKETADKHKLEGYYKQMYLYTYALRNYRFIPIDEIRLWFPRLNKIVAVDWKLKEEEKVMDELKETICRIKEENDFKANNSGKYFCSNLCSVRKFCTYK